MKRNPVTLFGELGDWMHCGRIDAEYGQFGATCEATEEIGESAYHIGGQFGAEIAIKAQFYLCQYLADHGYLKGVSKDALLKSRKAETPLSRILSWYGVNDKVVEVCLAEKRDEDTLIGEVELYEASGQILYKTGLFSEEVHELVIDCLMSHYLVTGQVGIYKGENLYFLDESKISCCVRVLEMGVSNGPQVAEYLSARRDDMSIWNFDAEVYHQIMGKNLYLIFIDSMSFDDESANLLLLLRLLEEIRLADKKKKGTRAVRLLND